MSTEIKQQLIRLVCASLIKEPKFGVEEDTRCSEIVDAVMQIADTQPEFILKVAVYLRQDLGIRSTACFLFALASEIDACRPFLKPYISHVALLPNDWLQIATMARDHSPTKKTFGAALRKVLVARFSEFSSFHLAKYNKESSSKKKASKAKKAAEGASSDDDDRAVQLPYTIKRLIRYLHISQPVEHVMCILGKKYPRTPTEFQESGLPGSFEQARAGTRMKLPVPETWETQISLYGNGAWVWESLLDNKSLPFMATLRNLRNMIMAGMDEAHHDIVLSRLTSPEQIASSKQFPYRFFSAYEAIKINPMTCYEDDMAQRMQAKASRGGGAAVGRGRGRSRLPEVKPRFFPPEDQKPTRMLLDKYKTALDIAVQLATKTNIKPIYGRTVVIVNVGHETMQTLQAQGAKGIPSVRTIRDVSVLLGLMFKYACEDCEVFLFDTGTGYLLVEQKDDNILSNMNSTLRWCDAIPTTKYKFPFDQMDTWLKYKTHLDALVLLDIREPNYEELNILRTGGVPRYVEKIRKLINPDLMYVSVNVTGGASVSHTTSTGHPNDVCLTGFSDSILQFVGERGSGSQLKYIERIHEVYKIDLRDVVLHTVEESEDRNDSDDDSSTEEETKADSLSAAEGEEDDRNVRVFISSTFLDMKNERQALVTNVFPTLRDRMSRHGLQITITEIDLRWGITQEEASTNASLGLCLNEVQRCNYFIGILGERYGYCPPKYEMRAEDGMNDADFTWLQEAEAGLSVTELEARQALHKRASGELHGCFFYQRDDRQFFTALSKDHKAHFAAESTEASDKMSRFRAYVDSLAMRRRYIPTSLNKDGTLDMKKFEDMVLRDLSRCVAKRFKGKKTPELLTTLCAPNNKLLENVENTFVGRDEELSSIKRHCAAAKVPIMILAGDHGVGKTALAARAASIMNGQRGVWVYPHFFGAGAKAADPLLALYRIASLIKQDFNLSEDFSVSCDMEALASVFPAMLAEVGSSGRIVIILDGVDQTSNSDLFTQLLPIFIPPAIIHGVQYIVTARSGASVLNPIQQRKPTPTILKLNDISDETTRMALIRSFLKQFSKKLEDRASQGNPLKNLALKKDGGNPGFLTFALDYLRLTSTYDTLLADVRKIPATYPQLLQVVLEACEKKFGKESVKEVLCAVTLSSSIGGAPESELPFLVKNTSYSQIRAIVVNLTGSLLTFQKGVVLTRNATITAMLRKRYLSETSVVKATHAALATSLQNRKSYHGAGLNCLLYHTIAGGLTDTFVALATDLAMIQRFADAGLLSSLVSAAMTYDSVPAIRKKIDAYMRFVVSHQHIISTHPSLTIQCARNLTSKTEVFTAACKLTDPPHTWISWENRQRHSDNMCKQTQRGSSAPILCAAFTPDNRLRIVGGKDWLARVHNIAQGKQVLALRHPNDVRCVAVHPGNTMLSTACADGTVRLFSLLDGALISQGAQHTKPVNGLGFSTKGDLLLSASDDTTVKLWGCDSGGSKMHCMKTLHHHSRPVTAVKVHSAGVYFASGSFDGKVLIFEGLHRDAALFETLEAPGMRAVRDLAWIPSLVLNLAVASYDGCVRLFNVSGRELLACLDGHFGRPVSSALFSPDGKFMLSADFQGCVKLWRAGVVGHELGALLGHSGEVKAMCHSGKSLITASADASLRTWEASDVAMEMANPPPHCATVTSVSFAPDASWFVTTSRDGYARVTETSSSELKFFMRHDMSGQELMPFPKLVPVTCSAIDKLGIRIYTGAVDGFVRIWNAFAGVGGNNGSLMAKVSYHHSAITGLYVTDACVFASSWDKSIKVINPVDFKLRRTHAIDGEITCLSGDGSAVWVGTSEGMITEAAEQRRKNQSTSFVAKGFSASDLWVQCVAVNSAITEVAVGSMGLITLRGFRKESTEDKTIEVLDDFFGDGRPCDVTAIAYVDHHTLAITCSDKTLRVLITKDTSRQDWDVAAWFHATAPLTSLAVHTERRVLLCAGDALGNTYVMEYREGGTMHALVDPSHATTAANHDASEDEWEGSSSTDEDSEEGAAPCTGTSLTTTEVCEVPLFRQYFERMPKNLSVAERKAFVKTRHQILVTALKTFKTSEESRLLVRMYADQQKQMALKML